MYDFDTDSLIIQVKDSPAFAGDVKIKFISANKVSSSPEEKVTFKKLPILTNFEVFRFALYGKFTCRRKYHLLRQNSI